jgi:hypothetical protein
MIDFKMQRLLKFSILSSFVLVCFSFTVLDWYEFKDYKGKFIVKLPTLDPMTEHIDTIKTTLGNLDYHTFYYAPKDPNAENKFFQVAYIDYPVSLFPKDSIALINDFLESTVNSSIEKINGKLLYLTNIDINTYPGKQWRTDYNRGNSVMKNKCFLVNNRMYLIQIATTRKRALNIEMERFLDSFKII